MKCEREEDEDCYDVLLKAKIITRTGVANEAGSRYTRISLLKGDDDFEVLMERVTDLVSEKKQDPDSDPLKEAVRRPGLAGTFEADPDVRFKQ